MPRYTKDDKYFECIAVGDMVLQGTGTIGRKPRTSSKDYSDDAAALKALDKLVAKREKAGFVRVHDRLEALSEFAISRTSYDYKLLERVVMGGVDLTFADSDGWTQLHEACLMGEFETALLFVRGGARPDAELHRNHAHPYGTQRKGTTPLQLARQHLSSYADDSPEAEHVVLARTVVELMEAGGIENTGASTAPEGPGFDEDTYGAVVFGQRVEGLSRAAIATAMARATNTVGIFPGGDLGETRAVDDSSKDARVAVCVGQRIAIASADDGDCVVVESPAKLDAKAVASQVATTLDGVCPAPGDPPRLWLVAGGPLASAKLVVGERVFGEPDGESHWGTTMSQESHVSGVRGRVLASSDDVEPLLELPTGENTYLVVRYD